MLCIICVKKNAQVLDEVYRDKMSNIFSHFQQKQFKLKLPKAALIVNLQFKSAKLQKHTEKRYLHLKGMISAI